MVDVVCAIIVDCSSMACPRRRNGPGPRSDLIDMHQQIAGVLVDQYAKHRELSAAAWKRFDASQRDALIRYRGSGYSTINALLRGGPAPDERPARRPSGTTWSCGFRPRRTTS